MINISLTYNIIIYTYNNIVILFNIERGSMMIKQPAFTLTEVLLAVAIVGIIAALILPATVSKFNEKTLDLGDERVNIRKDF